MRTAISRGKRLLPTAPWWALPVLTVAFLWKIVLTGRILAGVDVFTYFYPYRAFLTQAIRNGRLPLWNPYLFLGAPFFADSQAGVLYPLNVMLTWLPVPYQVSATIAIHIALAGLFAYLFTRRSLRLGCVAAFTASAVFAFGGFLLAQAEHVNQLSISAYLPLMLYLVDSTRERIQAAERPRAAARVAFWPASALAGVVALCVLAGHAQSLYICLAAAALYTLWPALTGWVRSDRSQRRTLAARSGLALLALAVVAAFGLVLAAVQVLPTLELSRLSLRGGGMTYREAVSFSLRPRLLLTALFPQYRAGIFSEYVAYVGIFGMALAIVGFWRSPDRGKARVLGLMLGVGLLLALGGFNPLYYALYRIVPGFDLFRVPARWMLLYHTAMAMLAGMGVQTLMHPDASGRPRWKPVIRTALALVAFFGVGTIWMERPTAWSVAVWAACAVLAALLIAAASQFRRWARAATALLVTAVICELFAASRTLAVNRPTAPQAYTSMRPSVAHLLADADRGRMLSLSDLIFDPGDLGEIRAIYGPYLAGDTPYMDAVNEAIYDYVVATKQKEILVPNLPMIYGIASLDGYGGGILPLRGYYELERLFLPADRLSRDGRLREGLTEIPDGRLLGAFGVKYIIADKAYDIWRDGVYYDLSHRAALQPGQSAKATPGLGEDFPADAVGVVSYLDGMASLPDGTPVAKILLEFADGGQQWLTLAAGRDTAEGRYGSHVAHARARNVTALRDDPDTTCYLTTLPLDGTRRIRRMEVTSTAPDGTLVIRGASLINRATGTHWPVVMSTSGRFELVHSGDVKIYRNLDAKPRLYVAFRAFPVADSQEAIDRLLSGQVDAQSAIAVESGQPLEGSGAAEVILLADEAHRVAARVHLDAPGYLVLSDADYPGWHATVDGTPAPIRRANGFVRAVYLDAGEHTVEFAFAPQSLRVGAACSAAALALWAAAAIAFAVLRLQPVASWDTISPPCNPAKPDGGHPSKGAGLAYVRNLRHHPGPRRGHRDDPC